MEGLMEEGWMGGERRSEEVRPGGWGVAVVVDM
jgi:hypothetical protein